MDCLSPDKNRRATIGICFALIVMVWFVFGQTLSFDFVNYDDDRYVYTDTSISEGITRHGLQRIFMQPHSANWHPLTSFSHMLDCQLHGLNPAGHHLSNTVLHMATVLLLFLVLKSMTGSLWRSAFVAAVFAIHPLRVESVAWISERKDVLSGFFFMLTLGAYLHYTRRPFSLRRYVPVCLLFALGLMSKPMLVTTPFVLLLLDWWPLKRIQDPPTRKNIAGLLIEKIPLLLLSAAACAATIWAQQRAVASLNELPLLWRFENAILSSVIYLKQLLFPAGLAVLYPVHSPLSLWAVGISLGVLTVITVFVVRRCRTQPVLLTGWLWYLGMLAPVIGILHVGQQAHADRYTYLPQIGLGILAAWLTGDWAVTRRRRHWLALTVTVLLICFMVVARLQAGYWRDSYSLWGRALACTQNNPIAHSNLGVALFIDGQTAEAIRHFERALCLKPEQAEIYNNLAAAYADEGRYPEAVAAAKQAYRLAATRCEPSLAEGIRTRLETYLTKLENKKNSPAE
jgi:tetratricopeptide (TPR) repeat protein